MESKSGGLVRVHANPQDPLTRLDAETTNGVYGLAYLWPENPAFL